MSENWGKIVLKTMEIIKENKNILVKDAWKKAVIEILGEITKRSLGCPMATFLILCEHGYIRGIPKDNYTSIYEKKRAVELNQRFALNAIEIIRTNPKSVDSITTLGELVKRKIKFYRRPLIQMEVVYYLWKNGYLI
jgi:hypothetical protein